MGTELSSPTPQPGYKKRLHRLFFWILGIILIYFGSFLFIYTLFPRGGYLLGDYRSIAVYAVIGPLSILFSLIYLVTLFIRRKKDLSFDQIRFSFIFSLCISVGVLVGSFIGIYKLLLASPLLRDLKFSISF